ncbi:hypothetical protein [Nonomuraea indica]|nr:hypothetical protein [Nonomuraea indica]
MPVGPAYHPGENGVAAAPPAIGPAFVQRHLVRGLSRGAVRG